MLGFLVNLRARGSNTPGQGTDAGIVERFSALASAACNDVGSLGRLGHHGFGVGSVLQRERARVLVCVKNWMQKVSSWSQALCVVGGEGF